MKYAWPVSVAPFKSCGLSCACQWRTTSRSAPYVRAATDAQARDMAQQAMAQVGIASIAAKLAGELSSKELRLMELARALAGQPRLLLLDETLAGLGQNEAEELIAVLRQLADDGITIVIITHEDEIGQQANRLVRMRDGVVQSDERKKYE